MLSHLNFRCWCLFAVNILQFALSTACSASDRHVYLMLSSIKYVKKFKKEEGTRHNCLKMTDIMEMIAVENTYTLSSHVFAVKKQHNMSVAQHWYLQGHLQIRGQGQYTVQLVCNLRGNLTCSIKDQQGGSYRKPSDL